LGWTQVTVCIDTNILVRAAVRDDIKQAQTAIRILREAELVAIPTPCLCELVWVLERTYKFTRAATLGAVTALLNASNVACDRQSVEAGLMAMRDGCDFADGVILYEGSWLGGETFASFDKQAARLAAKLGRKTLLL
jgi:predicted nucleic-acid-binding protein